MMETARVAASLWDLARDTHPRAPVVYEVGPCDCTHDDHAGHVLRAHVLPGGEYVLGVLGDFRPGPAATCLGVWCACSSPPGQRMLVVVTLEESVCLLGTDIPHPMEVVAGPLYRDMLAALSPADDELSRELAQLLDGAP